MAKVDEAKLEHIIATLENIQYGSVEITVHNGEIMQVDTTEKKRFFPAKRAASSPVNNQEK